MKKLKKRKMRQMKSTVKRKGNLLSLIKVIISKKLSQTRNVNTRCSYVCSLSHACDSHFQQNKIIAEGIPAFKVSFVALK